MERTSRWQAGIRHGIYAVMLLWVPVVSGNTGGQADTAMLIARFDALPDLFALARASGKEPHAEQARLAREHEAQKKPYRLSMPHRHAPRPCSTGAHRVPATLHTLVNPARNEQAELWESELHEAREHGAALPAAAATLLANLSAPADALPQSLHFEFGGVRVTKQGDELLLAVYPVWTDAQRPPPPDVSTGQRVLRLTREPFMRLWTSLSGLDLARYAHATDSDFTPTPPDVQHIERLKVVIDGKTRVEWSRGFQTLAPALRAPLAALERELREWLAAQPAPEAAKFRQIALRDVERLNGGQNVYVTADGAVTVQVVLAAQGDSEPRERRYESRLDTAQLQALRAALARHSPIGMSVPHRPGTPGEVWVELAWEGEHGERVTLAKWASDPHPPFDALHRSLLDIAKKVAQGRPVHEGRYDDRWRPSATAR